MTALQTRYKALLIDLDGTVYHGDTPINGASELIAGLNRQGWSYRFVTNNSSATPQQVADRLCNMGMEVTAEHICTSAQATAAYIAKQYKDATVMMIGEHGLKEAILGQSLRLVEQNPTVVVQGIDRQYTYEKGKLAVQAIRSGADFIMTNPDLLLPSNEGLIPGAGSIGAMLEAASGKKPIIIGKPSRILVQYSLDQLNCEASDALIIGDNMLTDISAGLQAGCDTALLYTGVTTEENYEYYRQLANCEPTYCYTNLQELSAALLND